MSDVDWDAIVKDKMGDVSVAEEPPVETPPIETPPEDAPPAPVTPPAGDDNKPVEKTQEELDAEKAAEEAEAELVKNETPEQTEARHKKEQEDADAKAAEEALEELNETPEGLSVEDIKKVLDERDQQAAFDAQRFEEISTEVANDLYPNGLDTTLKDEQGHVIASAKDYQQYIDPNASVEEAERVIMAEQARLNKEVQQAKDFILEKAELKHTMENEAVRVFNKYKEYFLKNPDIQPKIAENYRKTLTLQGQTVVNAPMGLEDFYDFAMKPYIDTLPKDDAPAVTPPAPVIAPEPPKPKEKVKDERLDLLGAPSGQDDGMVTSEGKPNWDKIVKNKMK